MNPISCEEPIRERRDDTRANNDRNESRPVYTAFPLTQALYSHEAVRSWLSVEACINGAFPAATPRAVPPS
jgi:hypothetical protein